MEKTNFPGIYFFWKNRKKVLVTKNLVPGTSVYGEKLHGENSVEYREWNPFRSKIAAAVLKQIKTLPFTKNSITLYLGAATGTTVSHLSDISTDGFIFALDFAPRVVRELVFLCEHRNNIAPLLFNAAKPETYKNRVQDITIVYQDIAQKNQVQVFLKNVQYFLKKNDSALLALKTRSVDSTSHPHKIYKEVLLDLEKEVKIIDSVNLHPFQRDHYFIVCRKK